MNRANVIGPLVAISARICATSSGSLSVGRGSARRIPLESGLVPGRGAHLVLIRRPPAGCRARPASGRRAGSGSGPSPPSRPARAATDRRRRRPAGGRTRSGPRPAARPLRRPPADGRGGPGCRRGPRRPAPPAARPAPQRRRDRGSSRGANAGDAGDVRRPSVRPAGGSLPAARAPRRGREPGIERTASSQVSAAAEVRPATTSSAVESARTRRIAASRSMTRLSSGCGPASIASPCRAEQDQVERRIEVDAQALPRRAGRPRARRPARPASGAGRCRRRSRAAVPAASRPR